MPRLRQATTSVSNWNFNNYHVQADMLSGEFISSDSILIAAGPPELSMIAPTGPGVSEFTETVFPVGVIDSVQISQTQQLQPLFEIGSSRAYFIPSKNIGALNMGRTIYSGPSLLKVLYAYYRQTNPNAEYNFMHHDKDATLTPAGSPYVIPDPDAALLILPEIQEALPMIDENPGYGDGFFNLASELFKQPTGLMFYLKNNLGQDYAAFYVENALISAHNLSINTGSNIMAENVSMQFDRIRPVEVKMTKYELSLAN